MTSHVDLPFELSRLIVFLGIWGYLLYVGGRFDLPKRRAWTLSLVGFGLLVLGSALSLFDLVALQVAPGMGGFDLSPLAVALSVLGTALVFWGLVEWLPLLIEGQRTRQEIETELDQRTEELAEANDTLRAEVEERRRAEAELAHWASETVVRSQERLQRVLTSAPIVFFMIDQEGRFTMSEGAGLTSLGLKPGEVVGSHYLEIYDDLPEIASDIERALAGETFTTHRTVEGRTFETWYSPHFDNEGELEGTIGVALDVTERLEALHALAETEEEVRTLSRIPEESPNPILRFDGDGRIVYANPVARDLFETWGIEDGVVPPDPLRERVVEAAEGGRPASFAAELGQRRYRVQLNPVAGASYVNMYGWDVTEHERMEAEMAKVQRLESLGLLAGGIAHDFNNLLTIILGNLSLTRMQVPENAGVGTVLEEAEEAAWRAQDLTQQLLTFSRGGAPAKREADLGELVQRTVDFTLRGSSVEATVDIQEDLGPLMMDPGQIGQVIQNLVLNARQAMEDGGHLEVTVRTVDLPETDATPAGRYVRVTVSDDGPGISPEDQARLFDPFFTTRETGTGLGLSICHNVVRKHGGAMTLDSTLGEGTTFRFDLPLDGPPVDEGLGGGRSAARRSRAEGEMEQAGGTEDAAPGRVLVMDDEATIRDLLKRMLERKGYVVDVVQDGEAAIDAFLAAKEAGSPYQLLMMDLTIPGGMGGREAMDRIRKEDPDTLAIVVSGYANDPVMADPKAHGFAGRIAKPFQFKDLEAELARVL